MRRNVFISHAIADLRKAWDANVKAHKYRDYINDSWQRNDVSQEVSLRDFYYSKKTKFIAKAIKKIKQFKLPIKYGTNKGITYFEFGGKQVSFHTFSAIDNVGGKKYKGEWDGLVKESFPLNFYS